MYITLDGKQKSNEILENLRLKIIKNNWVNKIKLVVIFIGENLQSSVYINQKSKACQFVGISCTILRFDKNIQENELKDQIIKLNSDKTIHGILIQLPIPNQINKDILKIIDPSKDVDGFHESNIGNLALSNDPLFVPCTPLGCLELLKTYNIQIAGKHVVLIGKSNIVGMPLSLLMMNEDATVTVCHKKTQNIKDYTKMADILIVGAGVPYLVKKDWVKDNVVVLDVGINKIEDKSKISGYKIVGDVDFEEVKNVSAYITPVPGGIGPMTVAMLINNIVESYKFTLL